MIKLFERLIRTYYFPFLLLLTGIIIFSKKQELQAIGHLLLGIRPGWLAVALGFQVLTYVAEGKVYESILRVWNKTEDFRVLMRRGIITIFIGTTVPSFSLAGNIYVARKFQDRGLSRANAVWAAIQSVVTYYLSLLILGVFSYLYLWTHDKLTVIELVFFLLFLVLAGFIMSVAFLGSKREGRMGSYYSKFVGKLTVVLERLFEQHNRSNESSKTDKEPPVVILRAVCWQIMRFLADGLTVYFIFWGFGSRTHFGIVMVGFVVATILGIISIFPGSIGQYEGAQILLYTSLGTSIEMAITVTLIYRLLAFWLPLGLGAFLYKKDV